MASENKTAPVTVPVDLDHLDRLVDTVRLHINDQGGLPANMEGTVSMAALLRLLSDAELLHPDLQPVLNQTISPAPASEKPVHPLIRSQEAEREAKIEQWTEEAFEIDENDFTYERDAATGNTVQMFTLIAKKAIPHIHIEAGTRGGRVPKDFKKHIRRTSKDAEVWVMPHGCVFGVVEGNALVDGTVFSNAKLSGKASLGRNDFAYGGEFNLQTLFGENARKASPETLEMANGIPITVTVQDYAGNASERHCRVFLGTIPGRAKRPATKAIPLEELPARVQVWAQTNEERFVRNAEKRRSRSPSAAKPAPIIEPVETAAAVVTGADIADVDGGEISVEQNGHGEEGSLTSNQPTADITGEGISHQNGTAAKSDLATANANDGRSGWGKHLHRPGIHLRGRARSDDQTPTRTG